MRVGSSSFMTLIHYGYPMAAEGASGSLPGVGTDSYQGPVAHSSTTSSAFKIIATTISKQLTQEGMKSSQKITLASCVLELIATGHLSNDQNIPALVKEKATEIHQKLVDAQYDRSKMIEFANAFLTIITDEIRLAQGTPSP